MSHEADRVATERLHTLISEEVGAIGPQEVDDEGDPISDEPMIDAVLEEWVLVMSWSDPKTGRAHLTRATSHGLARHHENGLLHEALYGFD